MADAPAPKPDTEQQPDPVEAAAETVVVETVVAESAAAEPVPAETVAAETSVVTEESAPEPQPPAASTTPTVASSVDVPASPAAAAAGEQEGGEWDLLVQKLRDWIASGQLQEQWQAARTPLSLLAGLIAVLLVLRVYTAVLNVLDSIPLLPGLLELVGVIALVQFSLRRLVRSEDRRQVISGLQQRWQSFRGRG
jgi:hypothetical protein